MNFVSWQVALARVRYFSQHKKNPSSKLIEIAALFIQSGRIRDGTKERGSTIGTG